ncbi:MAG: DUF4160 domain-containing protein [Chloroflexota bacterium]|nr:DUF4160 domain-containing protein [Chloroflexota bacterium]
MPTVLRFRGYRFFFFSNEGHEPPHIHVEVRGNYAKFWLTPVGLARSVGFAGPELTVVRQIVIEHVESFKERWDEFFRS